MQIKSLIGTLLLLTSFSFAKAQGIEFSKGSWDEIKAKAQEEHKYIFVDAYAVWCGPCKWMAKNIFTDAEVGKLFNQKFINYKFDMEKGEGLDFAEKYNIKAYPTLVFFNPKGEMVYKTVGAKQAEDLIEDAQAAMNPNTQMTTLADKFAKGEQDPEFLYNYIMILSDAYEEEQAQVVATRYLDDQDKKDWTSEKSFEVISRTMSDYQSEVFQYVAKQQANFKKVLGAEKVDNYILSGIMNAIYPIVREQDDKKYTEFKEDIKKLTGADAKKHIAFLDMQYYSRSDKAEQYLYNYYDNYCENSNQLNGIAWRYFEKEKDPAKLKKALNWVEKSIELDANWANLDTKANLLYKLEQHKEALKVAQAAIEMGENAGEDVAATKELLNAIQKELKTAPQDHSNGMHFTEGTWDEIKALAKKENKYIFVDAYAVWCGPCKWMAKNVFTDPSVGEQFNPNFVNYKFDMEKGEGPAFAQEHGVAAYPTLLFFNSDGELVHKAVGAQPVEQLIAESKNALDPKKQIFTLQKKFENGERNVGFLYDYSMALAGAYEDATEASTLYLKSIDQKDWIKAKNFELIMATQEDYQSEAATYVIQNREVFAKEHGQATVDRYIEILLFGEMMLIVEAQDKAAYKALRNEVSKLMGDQANKYNAIFDYQFHLSSKKAYKYQKVYFDNYCDSWSELNEVAWYYFENESSKKKLKKALSWADRSIELEKHWFNVDTRANLLFKLKRYEEAKEAAIEAIQLCKEVGDNPEETEMLLQDIEAKLGA